MIQKNEVILFQGDSITDGGRSRNEDLNHVLGHGYAYLVAARLMADLPEYDLNCINRGISGNRIVDLYARWREDALNLEPTLISILIGVNDVGAEISGGSGVSTRRFRHILRMLLEDTIEHTPGIRLVLCEPFFLPNPGREPFNDRFAEDIAGKADVVEDLSNEFGAIFVPLQRIFDRAIETRAAEYWLWDGVHPTPQGHELIAREWVCRVVDTD